MTNGGDALVQALTSLGVEVAFGLPGVHNLAAWKSFARSDIRLVGVRHEQTAGYAADGYARATGRLGVAVTTTGPGAANVVTAVGEAWASHSPVLVIATDIPTTLRRDGVYRGVLHETDDQAGFFRPVTKAQVLVTSAETVYDDVLRAGLLAMQHPRRPVYLEIPTDLLRAEVSPRIPVPDQVTFTVKSSKSPALSLPFSLLEAARPLIWAGGGATASEAGPQVAQLARALGAPVLTSYGGRGLIPVDHPCHVSLPPHTPDAGALWDAADLVLVLGSDLDFMNTQGFRQPRPAVLHVIDLAQPVNCEPDMWWQSDIAAAVGRTLDTVRQIQPNDREPWWKTQTTHEDGWSHLAGMFADEVRFLTAFESGLPNDVVVVADMCIPGYWYGGFGHVRQPRGLAYPVGWGTLGFGFPASLGTALSGRPTVALVGDGGFLFACGDLATAAQEQLPVTVVLVDDGGYGMLAYDFTKDGEKPLGCDLEPPDFVALARAFRVEAREVTVDELGSAVAAGIASRRPNLLVLKAQLTPPPNSSPNWYRALS